MRKSLLLGAICLCSTVLLAGDKVVPLNVKTGLWQTTETTIMHGEVALPPEVAAKMTPEQRARFAAALKGRFANATPMKNTYKSCVTEKDLKEDPFNKKDDKDTKCRETVIKSTGSDAEVQESCVGRTTKFQFHGFLHVSSPEHVTATGKASLTMGGRAMNGTLKLDSKWLGATCPPSVN